MRPDVHQEIRFPHAEIPTYPDGGELAAADQAADVRRGDVEERRDLLDVELLLVVGVARDGCLRRDAGDPFERERGEPGADGGELRSGTVRRIEGAVDSEQTTGVDTAPHRGGRSSAARSSVSRW
jgi:hypothetical protein